MNLHERCQELREEGIPVWIRMLDTAGGKTNIWVYYGYCPAILCSSRLREAEIAVEVIAKMHRIAEGEDAVAA